MVAFVFGEMVKMGMMLSFKHASKCVCVCVREREREILWVCVSVMDLMVSIICVRFTVC